MKDVTLYVWRNKPKNLPEWFKHQTISDVSWDQVRELHELGINILLKTGDSGTILYVDTSMFRQG
jgi:hypothetical protein